MVNTVSINTLSKNTLEEILGTLTRTDLRSLARLYNITLGRDKEDTIRNLVRGRDLIGCCLIEIRLFVI